MEKRILSRMFYSLVLIVALLGYVNLFRGYWYVLEVYFIPGKILVLIDSPVYRNAFLENSHKEVL